MPTSMYCPGTCFGELVEAGPPRHRGGDSDHALVPLGLGDEGVREDRGVGGRRRLRRRGLELLGSDRGGGVGFGDRHQLRLRLRLRFSRCGLAVDDRAGLRRVPLLHPLEAALLGGREPPALDGVDVDDDRAVGLERLPQRPADVGDVVSVDDPHVGDPELLEEQARRPVGLDRRLDLGAEALDAPAEPERQLRQCLLDVLAGVVEPRVEAEAVEVVGQGADVRRDRHAVVVEDDHDRRLQAARLLERLVGDAAGQGAVADHGDDLAVGTDPAAHRLLEADRVADRGRGVSGAHDVVRRLGDRAERGEAAVLADRRQPVPAAGQDLVRVRLMADVPEDLVPRRLHEAVQRDRQLAGAEVGAEVAADLADRVDDQLTGLLRELLQLLVVEALQVGRPIDPVEEVGNVGAVAVAHLPGESCGPR